jgi:hypothetical protein
MLSVCAASDPFAWMTNQFPLTRAVVVPSAVSSHVIDGVVLLVVPPFSCTTNWGSVLLAGVMAVGFRQSEGGAVMVPLRTVSPGGMEESLSHVSSNGMGKVAPTNRLKRLEAPFAPLISVDAAGAVVWALTISDAS